MNSKCAVLGAGYVGMPLAVRLARFVGHCTVYDICSDRIGDLRCGYDSTGQLTRRELVSENLSFSCEGKDLKGCNIFFVCVPTPADRHGKIDLSHLESATAMVSRHLSHKSLVIFESTVYPGCTEEVCVPILEENSGLKLNEGFLVGYSPERISPGMTGAELSSVRKLISGSNERAILALEDIYAKIIDAGVVTVPSIRVAELSKVFENTQRDVNIALVNELSKVCSALNIDTSGVLDAASTKWNFTRFDPGLVGGHCISVDPYYLIHKAVSHGYVPRLMSEARTVNESMPLFVVSIITRALGLAGVPFKSARVGVMGVTYKADVPDLRNSKVFDLIRGLKELFNVVLVCDSVIQSSVSLPKDVVLVDEKELNHLDILVVAVPHKSYATMDIRKLRKKCRAEHAIFVDIAGLYDRPVLEAAGFEVIRL